MLQAYIPLLLVVAFVVVNAAIMLGLSHWLSSSRPTAVKLQPYESGMPVLGDARERFSVKFYLVAMLFIIFDIEVVFLFPWAVAFNQLPAQSGLLLVAMLIFLGVLTAGFIYAWKRGALEWS
ncbi:MAG: NADH-quinone oxidoreductase subunit A [Gemmatimonadales bacterium]|jgi:NADH-quinone oxidoreductase subunit A|nr:MAG: NADH-quinone oxidoreductase subunit A [Gemmatimonadales bacterium]